MARPKKDIDARKVRQLAGVGLTVEELAAFFECSKDTLERRFAAHIKGGRERLCCSLKRRQFMLAMRGNAAMLIWLGKQHLNQRDQPIGIAMTLNERPRLSIPGSDARFES